MRTNCVKEELLYGAKKTLSVNLKIVVAGVNVHF
jgi:hypothetical protein